MHKHIKVDVPLPNASLAKRLTWQQSSEVHVEFAQGVAAGKAPYPDPHVKLLPQTAVQQSSKLQVALAHDVAPPAFAVELLAGQV